MVRYPVNYPQSEPQRRCPDMSKTVAITKYSCHFNLKDAAKNYSAWAMNINNIKWLQLRAVKSVIINIWLIF